MICLTTIYYLFMVWLTAVYLFTYDLFNDGLFIYLFMVCLTTVHLFIYDLFNDGLFIYL
jgi:hypothetical protein